MKTANYQKNFINIDQLKREDYQKIFNAGKNGELTCPSCHEPVRFYLGINKAPQFFHIGSAEKKCQDILSERNNPAPEQHYIERNGFRIPQGRAIIEENKTAEAFKATKMIETAIPFPPKNKTAGKITQPFYLRDLEENGVFLDKNQSAAVTETEGSLLVLAGAGSGKTRVLTARTAYMLEVNQIDPGTIMLVTFTSKAANEMKNRLITYPNMAKQKVSQLITGTFHSIFYRILLFHARESWNPDLLLKKDWQRDRILKEAGRELDLNEKEFAFDLAL